LIYCRSSLCAGSLSSNLGEDGSNAGFEIFAKKHCDAIVEQIDALARESVFQRSGEPLRQVGLSGAELLRDDALDVVVCDIKFVNKNGRLLGPITSTIMTSSTIFICNTITQLNHNAIIFRI
jgi:hypothetical protein